MRQEILLLVSSLIFNLLDVLFRLGAHINVGNVYIDINNACITENKQGSIIINGQLLRDFMSYDIPSIGYQRPSYCCIQ